MATSTDSDFSPDAFFKYASAASKVSMDRLVCLIEKREIYFSRPDKFNDPFEFKPQFQFGEDEDSIRKYLMRLYKEQAHSVSPANRFSHARSGAAWLSKNSEQVEADFHSGLLNVGVFCVAEQPDNLLMWSHYGDQHKGICLEFDGQRWPCSIANRVRYSEQYPVINPTSPTRVADMRDMLFRKGIVWSYEMEWRAVCQPLVDEERESFAANPSLDAESVAMLNRQRGTGIYHYDDGALKSITLGAKINQEVEDNIRKSVSRSRIPIKLKRAKLKNAEYGLNIEPA